MVLQHGSCYNFLPGANISMLLRLMFLLLTTEHCFRHSGGPGISYKRVSGEEK